MSILFVVESPNKIAKISKFLGKDYVVKASVGHFRDLDHKSMSIDFENKFKPIYVITKPDVVKNLKYAMKNIDMLYIASDLDKEGEAIAQHLYDVLKPKKYKRLVFNAITKSAIMAAIKNAGVINKNLVDSQKARRIIDRLYGYMISPLLQKKIGAKTQLSAGRVQSVAVKIIIDKENEINDFINNNKNSTYFRSTGAFSDIKATLFETDDPEADVYHGKVALIPLSKTKDSNSIVTAFMKKCLKSTFTVHSVSKKSVERKPAPPFETSSLQQEANRKFGMSVDTTMKVAQKLYEGGYITYMRTDSIEISEEGHKELKDVIEREYGPEYYQKNVYKNKSANAQEAHEAIRPTCPDTKSLEDEIDDKSQIKLYKLIWQRTIASQMKPAKVDVTTIQIDISKFIDESIEPFYYFQSQLEKITFYGFMKVYVESKDDKDGDGEGNEIMTDFSGKIPAKGAVLTMGEIVARQEYKKPPLRYSESSLVKTLKKWGIGRPSTYANTIKTIMSREYTKIGNISGIEKNITVYTIKSKNCKHIMQIFEEDKTMLLGKENKKIVPTELGNTVNNFLIEHFPEMLDYKFTAKMEEDLDAISDGNKVWHKVVKKFHDKLVPIVDKLAKTITNTGSIDTGRLLGKDEDGTEIYAVSTKYVPAVRKLVDEKNIYNKIPPALSIDKIKLKDAIKLFEYPKMLGKHENKEILLHKGQYGLYLTYDGNNYSLGEATNDVKLKEAIKIIKEKQSNVYGQFDIVCNRKKLKVTILNGTYGPYLQIISGQKKINCQLAGDVDPKKITKEQVTDIVSRKLESVKATTNTKTTKKAGSKTAKKPGKPAKPASKSAKK